MPKHANNEPSKLGNNVESDLPAGLSKPACRVLTNAGYLRLEQLAKLTEAELLQLHGVGPKALDLIRRALAEMGYTFADGY
jgi:DNA-directed RNA polymerase alpha subunit